MRKIEIGQIYLLGGGRRKLDPNSINFQPASRFPPVKISAPFSWNANPFGDNNWQSQLHMWRPLDAHICAYARSGNAVWLVEPQKLVADWQFYYRVHEPVRYVWADMNLGMRAMKIAWFMALHLSGEYAFSPEFISICENLRKSHLELLLNMETPTLSNHAFIDLHGAMALAQTLEAGEKANVTSLIYSRLEKLLASQFEPDGVHRENSPQYQEFALRYLKRMLATGWFESFNLGKIVEKAEKVLAWFQMPDGRLPPIGDTNLEPRRAARATMPAMEGEIFNSSGYAVIKPKASETGENSYLFFMCARHSLTHKHSDDLSVFWHENEDILIDPGKYAYQDSPERVYFRSTRAHNTLEVDHCDEYSRGRPRRPKAPLTQIDEASRFDDVFVLKASMLIQEHDLTHRRMLVFKPGKWLLACDSIFSTRPHAYALHWHFMPETVVEISGPGASIRLPSGRSLHACFAASSSMAAKVVTGQRKPFIQGFASSGYGTIVPAPVLSLTCQAECWQTASLFSLDEKISLKRIGAEEYALESATEKRVVKMRQAAANPLF